MSRGGWEARAIASGPVRPSSAAQLWMCGQSRWPSWRSSSAVVSARIIAVMAVLRSRIWPGSKDTSHPCGWPGACRAVWPVWSLVMAVSLMVRVMASLPGCGSWFGFQVGLWFAGAGGPGFQELGERRWLTWLPAAELVDDDHVLGTAWWPAAGGVGEREVIGVLPLAHVLVPWPLGRDMGTVGLTAGSWFVRCPAAGCHWPASLSAASLG